MAAQEQETFILEGNLLTKLHALLVRLEAAAGEVFGPDAAAGEGEGLSGDELRRLRAALRYADLQEGALWRAVVRELGQAGVRPVTPDRRSLNARAAAEEDVVGELEDEAHEAREETRRAQVASLEAFYRHRAQEREARRATLARRGAMPGGAILPSATRTKIIVDSHKAQVYPPLQQNLSATAAESQEEGDHGHDELEDFLAHPSTAAIASARPLSSGRARGSIQHPAGSGVQAVVALRAS